MIHLQNEDFNSLTGSGECIVDFYAEWCGPCKMIAPILEELKDEIKIIKVDVDMHQPLAMQYGVMSVPTLLFMKDGKILKQTLGFQSKEMIESNIKFLKQ